MALQQLAEESQEGQLAQLGQEGQLVIRGGWLFDSVSDSRRRNSGIIIRNGEIVAVDADITLPSPNGSR